MKTENIALRPVALYNPNKNQYLLIYCLGEDYMNLRGVILDADGRAVGKALQGYRCAREPGSLHHGIQFQEEPVSYNL